MQDLQIVTNCVTSANSVVWKNTWSLAEDTNIREILSHKGKQLYWVSRMYSLCLTAEVVVKARSSISAVVVA